MKQPTILCALLLVLAPIMACAGAAEKPAAEATNSDTVASLGDWSITLEELDAKAKAANMKAYQGLYDTRLQVLNQLIDEQLVKDEAAARGVDEEELFRVEVTEKLEPVTDEEVTAFYEQNKARMGERSLDEMSNQIKVFLTRQKALVARKEFLDGLRDSADFQIALDPPRVDVTVADNELVRGPDTAKVTIVEYSDFQ
jgi:hypothetical protein